jgi:hypothetical protein
MSGEVARELKGCWKAVPTHVAMTLGYCCA